MTDFILKYSQPFQQVMQDVLIGQLQLDQKHELLMRVGKTGIYAQGLLIIQSNKQTSLENMYETLTQNKPFWVNSKDQHIESVPFLKNRVGKEVARSLR